MKKMFGILSYIYCMQEGEQMGKSLNGKVLGKGITHGMIPKQVMAGGQYL